MTPARAAIDLGSNSALLLVVRDDARLLDQALVVGLGRGLGDRGELREDRMHAALEVLATYAARAQHFGVPPEQVVAITTSAARRATNAEAFLTRVQAATGLRFRVVPGELEAALSWWGGTADLPAEPTLLLDIGGGSSELAWGTPGASAPDGRVSLEVGSVRLTEAHLGDGPHTAAGLAAVRAAVHRALATVDLPAVARVVGVAGTAVTWAATHAGHSGWHPEALHGHGVPAPWLRTAVEGLLGVSPAVRRAAVPAAPDRADYLAAGGTIALEVLRAAGASELHVSTRDLRDGALMAAAAGTLAPAPDRRGTPAGARLTAAVPRE